MNNLPDALTVRELRALIRSNRVHKVLVQPRFGTSETWIKISKAEALEILKGGNDGDTAKDLEIYGGNFGSMTDCSKDLYLGG